MKEYNIINYYFIFLWDLIILFKTPRETVKEISDIGLYKAENKRSKIMVLNFLGGVYMALGGMIAEVVASGMFGAGYPFSLINIVF